MTMPSGGDNNRQAQVTVTANVDPFTKSMGVAAKAADAFGTALKKLDQSIFSIAKKAGAVAMGGGALALFGDVKDLQKAAQYQDQLVKLGVQAGVTGKNLDVMGKGVASLSQSVPMSSQALLQLATQLAAVGVSGTSELRNLTEQAVKLAAATNTAPGELLTGLIEVGRSLGGSLETVSRYGDVLTTLQQQMGTSAADVLNFSQNIAAVANKAGIGEASILGFSSSFRKLGIDSASGAQTFNTIVNDMTDSVSRGTTRMQLYANVLGETSTSFKKSFENDPSGTFVKFVDAIAAQGQRGGQILDEFGLDGTRLIKVFAALTSGQANLRGTLMASNSAFAQGDATAKASAQSWDTFSTKIEHLRSSFENIGLTIGQGFLPVADKAAGVLEGLGQTVENVVGFLNQVHLPVIGDWASKWAGVAAGIGLAAGAFGLMAANITKLLGVWRIMTGVIGGKFIAGLGDGVQRVSMRRSPIGQGLPLARGGETGLSKALSDDGYYYAKGPRDLGPEASRTQNFMYRTGYGLGRGMRTAGPLVNPEGGRLGTAGRVRGLVGTAAMFPVTRAKQIGRQAKDTILHPWNSGNRDDMATDPFSAYGGYQQVVRAGGDARKTLVKHLTREGAADWEQRLGGHLKEGFGDNEINGVYMRQNRWALGQETWNKAHMGQMQINDHLSDKDARELLHKTQLTQMATGEDTSGKEVNYDNMSRRQINKALKSQAVWVADNAHRDALKQFDEKTPDKDIDKLAGPFAKLATKVKEITKSITTDSASVIRELLSGLQSFFEKMIAGVVRAAQKAAAEIVKLRTMAAGGTTAEATVAAAAVAPPPLQSTARRSTYVAPAAAPDATRIGGATIPATGPGSLPHYMNNRNYNGVNVEGTANAHLTGADRIRDSNDNLRGLAPRRPSTGQSMTSFFDEKMPALKISDNLQRVNEAFGKSWKAVQAFGSGTLSLTRSLTTTYAMPMMLYGGLAVAGLQKLASALDQTASDSQYAGQEIQKALGRNFLTGSQLAQQAAQSAGNKADQDPWGKTESKSAKSTQFAQDHASTLDELSKIGLAGKDLSGIQTVMQQQINALVQQSSGSAVDDAGKQQIRELLMNSGASRDDQRKIYGKLDFSGQTNADIYGVGMQRLQKAGTNTFGFGPDDLNKTLTAQAATDIKVNGNAAGAAYMLLQSEVKKNGGLGYAAADPYRADRNNPEFQNLANGIIAQLNQGTTDQDPSHISPNNKAFGMGWLRSMNTSENIDSLLHQLNTGDGGSKALAQELISEFKAAGLQIDGLGHVSGDTTAALKILEANAGGAANKLQMVAAAQQLNTLSVNKDYQQITGNPKADVGSLLANPESVDYQAQVHTLNQKLIDDGAKLAESAKKNPVFSAKVGTGITDPNYIAGLKNAVLELQKLKDSYGTPTDTRWKSADALQQEDMQRLNNISSVMSSPAEQIHTQTDILTSMGASGVDANNADQLQAQVQQSEQLYDQQLGTLKQAYMNVHESHVQMGREQDDYQRQMLISQRDYNRQVAENNYQFGKQQDESLYQFNWSKAQQLYSFQEQIRNMKYSLANAFGNAGSMVQAQYTQGAGSTALGMQNQVKMLQDSKDAMDQLSQMGLSGDAIRVLKLDDPTNVAQAKRYITDFANNPDLIKTFNDSIGARLNLTDAIASDPNNSSYSEMKRTFDKTASDAATEYGHATDLATEAFTHSMDQSAQSFAISMGDFQTNYNIQMSRTADDMSRMNQYITQSVDDLTSWAQGSGIPGISSIADEMAKLADAMKKTQDQIDQYTVDKQKANDNQQYGTADIRDKNGNVLSPNAQVPLSALDQTLGLGGGALPGTTLYPPGGSGTTNTSLGRNQLPGIPALAGTGQIEGPTTAANKYATAMDKAKTAINNAKDATKNSLTPLSQQKDANDKASDAIMAAVGAAGQKATADNQSKSPAEQAAAVVKAERDTFDQLTGKIGGVPGALQNLGDHLHSSQDPMKTTKQVADDLKTGIDNIPKDPKVTFKADTIQATGALDNMKTAFGQAVHWVVDTVLNGLIGAWDGLVKLLHLPDGLHIDPLVLKGFHTGGFTGEGRRFDPAGVVHAGEFVLNQEKTRKHRPLLEAIHRGEEVGLPGYAGGGAVTWPQLDALRKQMFPGSVLTSAYRPGANDYHGMGEAIDIGVAGNKQSGLMPIAAKLAQTYPQSTELIHNPNGSIKNGRTVSSSFWGASTWAQHANHVHWAMTPQALSGGASAGNGDMSIFDAILHPVDYLHQEVNKLLASGANQPASGILSAMPNALIDNGISPKISKELSGFFGHVVAPVQSFLSKINPFATGGVINGAQLGVLGEAGPEVVLPLNSTGAQFMAQTVKASLGQMGIDTTALKQGRTAQYSSPARSEMHVHHTDASTNFHGDITVVASDPNQMARQLAERKRLTALTHPVARR